MMTRNPRSSVDHRIFATPSITQLTLCPELLSEQQLGALIPPSLRYLLAIATHRYPRYLLRILNSFDELYAFISLLVERHYLRTYGGGFTENFYGLKRERVLHTKGHEIPRASLGAPEQVRETLKLTNKDVWKNLLVMVLLPYTKRKLDEHYDIHAASANILGPAFRGDALQDNATYKQRIFHYYKLFLRKIYPSINAAYYFSLLAFNLAYLFDTSKYHNPFFWLIGTRIRRMNQADYKAIAAAAAPPPVSGAKPGSQSLLSPRTFTQIVYPRLLSSLKILLPTSIFALKFLEWWHASDFARQLSRKAAEGLELPAPTISGIPKAVSSTATAQKSGVTFATSGDEKDQAKEEEKEQEEKEKIKPPISAKTNLPIFTVAPPQASSSCPICLSAIQTPTAAQTGYVFCYTCIFRWLEGEHPRQVAFMQGGTEAHEWKDQTGGNREGSWEDGRGRCAVSGRRLLGGSGGLRRVMV
jgi:peroxin-12